MSTYTVVAKPWEHGWELHIAGEGVTQVRTLDKALAQVRSYLETLHDTDLHHLTADDIDLQVDIAHADLVQRARDNSRHAAELQVQASREMREAAHRLREDGFSVTDTAAILGVSRGRISQLAS